MYNSNNGDDNNYRNLDSNNYENDNSIYNQYSYYFSYLNGLYNVIRDNLNTQSLFYYSGKALEYVVYAGEKVYEKSCEGLHYIKNKFSNNRNRNFGNYVNLSNDNFENGGESLIDKSNNIFDV